MQDKPKSEELIRSLNQESSDDKQDTKEASAEKIGDSAKKESSPETQKSIAQLEKALDAITRVESKVKQEAMSENNKIEEAGVFVFDQANSLDDRWEKLKNTEASNKRFYDVTLPNLRQRAVELSNMELEGYDDSGLDKEDADGQKEIQGLKAQLEKRKKDAQYFNASLDFQKMEGMRKKLEAEQAEAVQQFVWEKSASVINGMKKAYEDFNTNNTALTAEKTKRDEANAKYNSVLSKVFAGRREAASKNFLAARDKVSSLEGKNSQIVGTGKKLADAARASFAEYFQKLDNSQIPYPKDRHNAKWGTEYLAAQIGNLRREIPDINKIF